MIDRYTLTCTSEQLQQRFKVDVTTGYEAQYNAAPSNLLPIILSGSEGLSYFYWGLPPGWAKNKVVSEKIINLKLETLNDRPTQLRAIRSHRCLIPADGIYIWKKTGKKTIIPYRWTLADKSVFGIPGIWEEFDDNEGNRHHTFMMITNLAPAEYTTHTDRFPVILSPEFEQVWLNPSTSVEDVLKILQESKLSNLTYYSVAPTVWASEKNLASFIFPAPPADLQGNLTLFD
ncbi:MAG: SOS response-associated peptidase [Chryseotalea sp.]|jgi:putative SOS response-associated peptidase YedK|nr:SOS response-associated peptidase [Flammeovirgaceae bacterium]